MTEQLYLYSSSEVTRQMREGKTLYCLDMDDQEHITQDVRNPGGEFWLCLVNGYWITARKVWILTHKRASA